LASSRHLTWRNTWPISRVKQNPFLLPKELAFQDPILIQPKGFLLLPVNERIH